MSDEMLIFSAMTELEDDILLDAKLAWDTASARRRAVVRVLAAAACAALIVSGVYAAAKVLPALTDGSHKFNGRDRIQPLAFNDVAAPPVDTLTMYELLTEDFCPMSAEEALAYFGVRLPREGLIPGLELTGGGCFGGDYGVYRRPEGGVYFDVNAFKFEDPRRSVTLTLRTRFNLTPSPEWVANGPEQIVFSDINGWKLALFRYTDKNGVRSVCTEFVVDGVMYYLRASGLTNPELSAALANLLPVKYSAPVPFTATGVVTYVDSRSMEYLGEGEHRYEEFHDYIDVDFGGTRLTVWLLGQADRFSVGDVVTVTWNGEPATAYNIWPGQLVSVE